MGLASLKFGPSGGDPYPFVFLLFLSNLVQLWALPVLAVGQNVLNRKAELQADEMYKTTVRSFQDIEQIRDHLDAQDGELIKQSRLLSSIIDEQVHRTSPEALGRKGTE